MSLISFDLTLIPLYSTTRMPEAKKVGDAVGGGYNGVVGGWVDLLLLHVASIPIVPRPLLANV